MSGYGFFRLEADAMHDLVSGLDSCEERLRGVTSTMKGVTPEATGSAALDQAYGSLAGRLGGEIDELGKQVDAILERLKVCVTRYEQADRSWAQQLGRMLQQSSPGGQGQPAQEPGAGGAGSSVRAVLDGEQQ